jgi:hypothetical protein
VQDFFVEHPGHGPELGTELVPKPLATNAA